MTPKLCHHNCVIKTHNFIISSGVVGLFIFTHVSWSNSQTDLCESLCESFSYRCGFESATLQCIS